jgi:hypothetical protein
MSPREVENILDPSTDENEYGEGVHHLLVWPMLFD